MREGEGGEGMTMFACLRALIKHVCRITHRVPSNTVSTSLGICGQFDGRSFITLHSSKL